MDFNDNFCGEAEETKASPNNTIQTIVQTFIFYFNSSLMPDKMFEDRNDLFVDLNLFTERDANQAAIAVLHDSISVSVSLSPETSHELISGAPASIIPSP